MTTKSLIRSGELFPALMDDAFAPWNEWFDKATRFGKIASVPAVNVLETLNEFSISLAAPGLKKDDFKIDVEGNILTISAEKREKNELKDERYTKKEYSYHSFSRSFTLPEVVNRDHIEARYENGVLQLDLPKSEESKKLTVKHIAIK